MGAGSCARPSTRRAGLLVVRFAHLALGDLDAAAGMQGLRERRESLRIAVRCHSAAAQGDRPLALEELLLRDRAVPNDR